MDISIIFEPHEIEIVQNLVTTKLANGRRFVKERFRRNVEGQTPEIDDNALWTAHMMCLLTTQQRSGPGSPINRLLDQKPFPLDLTICRSEKDLERYVLQQLTDAQGIRRTNKIAKAVYTNLHLLENSAWGEIQGLRDRLLEQRRLSPVASHRQLEEDAAHFMDNFTEFGPKQSRNFWQSLGLTRYVFVLDSRILGWLRHNLTFKPGLLTTSGLGDHEYYQFISGLLFELCEQAGVLPCMFDAAVFDSFDEGTEWAEDVIW